MSGLNDVSTQLILRDESDKKNAAIADSSNHRKLKIRKETIFLDNGYGPDYGSNAYLVNYPFKGVFVKSASDGFTTATLAVDDDSSASIQSGFDLGINDKFNIGRFASKGFIVAPPQPGKKMTIWFIVDGDFTSGSQLSLTAGGVSVTTGTGMTPQPAVSVGASAVKLLSSDSTQKKATVTNLSGGTIYVSGTSAVKTAVGGAGTTIGIPIGVGQNMEWTNQGELWAISDSSSIVAIQKEN